MSVGERPQANLRMSTEEATALVGPQYAKVRSVDYVQSRVEVYNSNGTRWARVLFPKASGQTAGENDMPNVDDWGVIVPVNGDGKSAVWIGSVYGIDPLLNLVKDSNYPGSSDGLVHRQYRKHETGSFAILDKIGNIMMQWFKKAAKETDTALKNLTFSVQAGVLTVTHFRGSPSVRGLVLTSDQDGNVNVQNFKSGGVDLASSITIDDLGGMTLLNAVKSSQIRFNVNGDIVLDNGSGATLTISQATGEITLNSPSVKLGNGTRDALVKAGFLTKYDAHFHISAAPGQPTTPPTVPALPDVETATQNVEGS